MQTFSSLLEKTRRPGKKYQIFAKLSFNLLIRIGPDAMVSP